MDLEGFGCEMLEQENHGAESGCGKIRGEFGIRVCTTVWEREGRKRVLGKILSDTDVGC